MGPSVLINESWYYFNWKKKYDGMQPPEMRRLKQLEDENAKLKKIVADLSLDREMLRDVIRRQQLPGFPHDSRRRIQPAGVTKGRKTLPSGDPMMGSRANPAEALIAAG